MIHKFTEILIILLFALVVVVFCVIVVANIKIMADMKKELKDSSTSCEKCRQWQKELYDKTKLAERSAVALRQEVNDFVEWRKEQGKKHAAGERPKE